MSTPDYTQEMKDKLLRQFRDAMEQENIDKFFDSIGLPFTDLADTIVDLIEKRGLSTAEGAQLDIIGAIVGQPRGATTVTDNDYRELIKTKIAINTGNASQIILNNVFKIISESTTVFYFPNSESPAQAALLGDGPKVDDKLTRQLMGLVKGAGVRLYLQHYTGLPFAFADSDGGLHPGYGTFAGGNDQSLAGEFITQYQTE